MAVLNHRECRVPINCNEHERLTVLHEYAIDRGIYDPGMDRITQLAVNMFDVPIALVSLVDEKYQLFVSHTGLDACETPRGVSFCSHAIKHTEIMIIPDARRDPRFADNPLVTGEPFIRFYAGAPLITPSEYAIGTLCLIDTKPREGLSKEDQQNLRDLSNLVLDRLELHRLEAGRRASKLRFESIAATSPDAIVCTDGSSNITFFNKAAEKLFGYTSNEIIGCSASLMAPVEMIERLQQLAVAAADESFVDARTFEMDVQRKTGSVVPVELSISTWQEDGRPSFGAILRDISERRLNEARLYRLAHLDPLTELPNRAVLQTRIEESVKNEDAACVILLDLDGFKDVNDLLGHAAGDKALLEVADRLRSCIRPSDVVARMGGDEFAILIPALSNSVRAAEVADAAIAAIGEIRSIEGQPVNLGASAGIALFPDHGLHAEELLSSADLALYQAKAEGRNCRRLFTPSLRLASALKRAYLGEFRRALDKGEFELFYQPQVRLSDGELVGAEALLRWHHPEKGLLGPGAFLASLDTSAMATPVGDWVLRTAAQQASEWLDCRPAGFKMGVNLFGAQFHSGDLVSTVSEALRTAGLPGRALELEITENIILRHDDVMLKPLCSIREMGVGIAFDDYGTGYASLSMLKRYPLTRLKIDQSFVRAMCQSPEDAAIVRAILYLGRSFGLDVIAEGAETEEQVARLKKKNCEEVQGFYFGQPMPSSEFSTRFNLLPRRRRFN